MAEVESHPFDLDTMLFMDWRDDFTSGDNDMAVLCCCCHSALLVCSWHLSSCDLRSHVHAVSLHVILHAGLKVAFLRQKLCQPDRLFLSAAPRLERFGQDNLAMCRRATGSCRRFCTPCLSATRGSSWKRRRLWRARRCRSPTSRWVHQPSLNNMLASIFLILLSIQPPCVPNASSFVRFASPVFILMSALHSCLNCHNKSTNLLYNAQRRHWMVITMLCFAASSMTIARP